MCTTNILLPWPAQSHQLSAGYSAAEGGCVVGATAGSPHPPAWQLAGPTCGTSCCDCQWQAACGVIAVVAEQQQLVSVITAMATVCARCPCRAHCAASVYCVEGGSEPRGKCFLLASSLKVTLDALLPAQLLLCMQGLHISVVMKGWPSPKAAASASGSLHAFSLH